MSSCLLIILSTRKSSFSPISYAWHGGKEFSNFPNYFEMAVTKAEYDESGVSAANKFELFE